MKNSEHHFFSNLCPNSNRFKLFDYMPIIFYFIKDNESTFMGANDALSKMLGLQNQKDIIGKKDKDFFPPYLTERFLETDNKVLNEGKTVSGMELLSNANQTIDWHSTVKTPLYSKNGEIIGLEGFTRFIKGADLTQLPYPKIYKAIEFIQNNFKDKINIKNLSEISCLSVSSFERHFKKHFKMTPLRYIRRMRINETCSDLLNTNKSLSQIGLDAGFCDQSYFTTEFLRIMKVTPSKYRKEHLNS